MAVPNLQYIAGGSSATTTVTIPVGHQAGDILIIFAFRDGSTTVPTLPAGWTSNSSGSATLCACRLGFKIAGSSAETSGTWTNATELVCVVYRGQATNKTPLGTAATGSGTTTSNIYPAVSPMQCPGTSWMLAFSGTSSVDTTIETAPTGMTNRVDQLDAVAEVVAHDTNGVVSDWPQQTVAIGGTAGNHLTRVVELFAEALGPINNYQFVKVGDGMSTSEKIR